MLLELDCFDVNSGSVVYQLCKLSHLIPRLLVYISKPQ